MTHPLRQWRKDKKIGLDELAKLAGIQSSHLSMIERGIRGVSLEVAAKLADATNGDVPIDAFVGGKQRAA